MIYLEELHRYLQEIAPENHFIHNWTPVQLGQEQAVAHSMTSRYSIFKIPKPDGTTRRVENPYPDLKSIQRLLIRVLEQFPLHDCVYGIKGKGLVDNALRHDRQNFVLKMDIKKFFPTTRFEYYQNVINWAKDNQVINTRLFRLLNNAGRFCFVTQRLDLDTEIRRLPTGAPTSPLAGNISLHLLDQDMLAIADEYGLVYTRYMDDMVLSGQEYPGGLQRIVHGIVKKWGYRVNHNKSCLMYRNSDRQLVTGVCLTSKYKADRTYKKKLRAELDHHAREHQSISETLKGKLAYLGMLHPALKREFEEYFFRRVMKYHG